MKKTKLLYILLTLTLAVILCSCAGNGIKPRDNGTGEKRQENGNDPTDAPKDDPATNPTDTPKDDPGNDNPEDSPKPKITIKVLDKKHADVIVDCSSIVGGSFDNIYCFDVFMPDGMYLDWKASCMYYFHPEFGSFGDVTTEKAGDTFVFHISMEYDPEANYPEEMAFLTNYSFESFADMKGTCHIRYSAKKDVTGTGDDAEINRSRDSDLEMIGIVDMSSFNGNEDEPQKTVYEIWSPKLIGTWEYYSTVDTDDWYACYACYIFNEDGTYITFKTGTRELVDGKVRIKSLSEARAERGEYIRNHNLPVKDYDLYKYDGEMLRLGTAYYDNHHNIIGRGEDSAFLKLEGNSIFLKLSNGEYREYKKVN